MESAELDLLEMRVDHLLRIVGDLQAENQYLRNQMTRHAREKNLWYQNNRVTAGKIKQIITHLQEGLV